MIGAASATVITANSSIVTTAITTPGPTSRVSAQRPVEHDARRARRPAVASAAPSAWAGSSDSPRRRTASTTVVPAVRHDDRADTTLIGPIRSAVK